MFDLIIKNGKLVDGTGNAWFWGDLAVSGERIVEVGRLSGQAAKRVIDAAGLVVAPGFIDSHSHSDQALLLNPSAESKIYQGVTGEVIGQCGSSAAPRAADDGETGLAGLRYSWQDMADYLSQLDQQGVALNVIPLFGHGNVRRMVMGMANRQATAAELTKMCELAEQAMQQGAFGFTSGLIYPPSSYADLAELVAVARAVAAHGGIYATHMRDEGAGLLDSVREAIAVGEETGIPVHISHHKAMGEENWGLVRDSLALVDAKRAAGLDITLDQYPYIASSTGLKSIIPQWAHADGVEAMRRRLLDPETGIRIRQEIADRERRWEYILVSSCNRDENRQYEGKNMQEIAIMRDQTPMEAALALLLAEDFNVGMVRFAMCEEDVEHVMRHPLVMVGSDSSALATTGPLSQGKPHPRSYGTFARVLGYYTRERRVLSLESAVRKMTSLAAARFQLWDRGLLRPGCYADITVFDSDTIRDQATFVDPHRHAAGVHYVLVNGQLALEQGEQTGQLAGRALRSNRR